MKFAILAVLAAVPSSAAAQALNLVCQGSAARVVSESTSVSGYDNHGNYVNAGGTNLRTMRSEERLRVQLDEAGAGRIKPPASLNPPISRGKDCWWDLEQLTVTDTQIRGRYSLNILNHPSVVIDRQTGDISVKGFALNYDGTCERAPDEPEGRKF